MTLQTLLPHQLTSFHSARSSLAPHKRNPSPLPPALLCTPHSDCVTCARVPTSSSPRKALILGPQQKLTWPFVQRRDKNHRRSAGLREATKACVSVIHIEQWPLVLSGALKAHQTPASCFLSCQKGHSSTTSIPRGLHIHLPSALLASWAQFHVCGFPEIYRFLISFHGGWKRPGMISVILSLSKLVLWSSKWSV